MKHTREDEEANEIPAEVADAVSEVGWNHLTQITQQNVETNWNVRTDQWKLEPHKTIPIPIPIPIPILDPIHIDWIFGPFIVLAINRSIQLLGKSRRSINEMAKWRKYLTDTRVIKSTITTSQQAIGIRREIQTIYSNDKRLGIGALRPD